MLRPTSIMLPQLAAEDVCSPPLARASSRADEEVVIVLTQAQLIADDGIKGEVEEGEADNEDRDRTERQHNSFSTGMSARSRFVFAIAVAVVVAVILVGAVLLGAAVGYQEKAKGFDNASATACSGAVALEPSNVKMQLKE